MRLAFGVVSFDMATFFKYNDEWVVQGPQSEIVLGTFVVVTKLDSTRSRVKIHAISAPFFRGGELFVYGAFKEESTLFVPKIKTFFERLLEEDDDEKPLEDDEDEAYLG